MEARVKRKSSPRQSPYPVSIYGASLSGRKLELRFLLPSEGLRSFRFNWYPDSRQLVDSALQSCWERSRELLAVELGRGYLPYLTRDTDLIRWLESRRGDDEISFRSWENAPVCEHTLTDKGVWRISGDPFRVYLQRGGRKKVLGEGGGYLLARIYYGSELIGPLEKVFALGKGHTPENLAASILRLEKEKAEESVRRLYELLGEEPKSSPSFQFIMEESRVIYAYLSHFLNGRMRKAEFFL
jgi:hypothetical protein